MLSVIWLNIKSTFFRLFEWIRVVFCYYPKFLGIDCLLAIHYILRNPHQISKHFLKKRGEKQIYAYGETPLTTLDKIARECRILSKDVVFDLGCGPGRTTFWLNLFVKCQVVGIDYLPTFITNAERVKRWASLNRIEFQKQDMLTADLKRATAIYLYGTCLEDQTIETLISRFSLLSKGTKVITVSYPLTDYCSEKLFTVAKEFEARFPWGKADVYLNIKN